ncbi:hypothetical protein D2N39_03275 [Gemmobacter lutimaris]|uniref:Uncharacterized protein n=1 Tax=Gemmobacter lutimaris TaxID=2306023 RepID=A0A398BSR5_9RHOB|nr:hypothetical protein D2N39_03275 [Gemmobacter lutimaris]
MRNWPFRPADPACGPFRGREGARRGSGSADDTIRAKVHRANRPSSGIHTQQPGLAVRADFHLGHRNRQRLSHAKPQRADHESQQHKGSGQKSQETAHGLA